MGYLKTLTVPLLALAAAGGNAADTGAVEKTAHGVVVQATMAIRNADRMWFTIAPEGTRKWVERWKPGFWHIARNAGVPVVPAYFDYANKVIGIGLPFELTGDMHADIARIQRWYAPYKGRNHDVLQPVD